MANDAVIIAGKLDDAALRSSISNLVSFVDNKFSTIATKIDDNMIKAKGYLGDFANAARQTTKDIKQSFDALGTTFDDFARAMKKAAAAANNIGNGGNGGGGGNLYGPDTVGFLEKQIRDAEKLLRTFMQWTPELQNAVNQLATMRGQLKQMLTDSDTSKKKSLLQDQKDIFSFSPRNLNEAEDKLRRLQGLLTNMSLPKNRRLFDEAHLNRVNKEIDKTEKLIEKMRKQSSMPTTVTGVLGMKEDTLDNIARKMQAISQMRGSLAIGSPELQRLNAEYERLGRLQNEALGKNTNLIKSNQALARSFNYIRNRIIYALSIGAITGFVKQLVQVRGEYELLERSLGVLNNSFQKGHEIFSELSQMALKSPFTLIELGTAAKQLSAYDFKASEVVDVTKRMADISAALGVPMERLVYNLGQIRAQGVLTARDARDFANAGLAIVPQLAEHYSKLEHRAVSTADVYDRLSKKMVSYSDVMEVINGITDEGGKFFDFQAKQADTLKVRLANLTLAWNNMLNDMGQSNQGVIETPIKALTEVLKNWRTVIRTIGDLAAVFGIFKTMSLAVKGYNLWTERSVLTIHKEIAAEKEATRSRLEKKQATQTLTAEEQTELAMSKRITAEDYKQAIGKRKLSKAQAQLLVSRNKNNIYIAKAVNDLGLLSAAEIRAAQNMGRLGRATKQLSAVMGSIFSPQLLLSGAIMFGMDVYQREKENEEAMSTFQKNIADNSKETSQSIEKFMDSYRDSIRRAVAGGNEEELSKTWEAVKEQIENTTAAADTYLAVLANIEDMSSKIDTGSGFLADAKRAAELMERYASNIEFTQTSYWDEMKKRLSPESLITGYNLFYGSSQLVDLFAGNYNIEGLNDDAKDYLDSLKKIRVITQEHGYNLEYVLALMNRVSDKTERINLLMQKGYDEGTAQALANAYGDGQTSYKEQQAELQREIDDTIASFMVQLRSMGQLTEGELIEVLSRYEKAVVDSNQNLTGEARQLFHKSLVDAVSGVYPQFKTSLAAYQSDMRNFWQIVYNANKDTFKDMTIEELKQIDWTTDQYKALVDNALRSIEKESIPETFQALTQFVRNASQLSISIPVFLDVVQRGQGVTTDFQKYYDTMLTKNPDIDPNIINPALFAGHRPKANDTFLTFGKEIIDANKKATSDLKELNRQFEGAKKSNDAERQRLLQIAIDEALTEKKVTAAIMAVFNYQEEAKKAGGGGRGHRGGGGGREKDPLVEAIQEQIKVIHEIRSNYDKLYKAGAADADAIKVASDGYAATINQINKVLSAFGVAEFKASDFAGKNVKEIKKFFENELNALIKSGKIKAAQVTALDVEIKKLDVDARVYDLEKVTNGLNSQLAKIKDDYELSLELQANPELGNMFADVMGIDAKNFPKTLKDVIKASQDAVDTAIKGASTKDKKLANFDIMKDDLNKWAKDVGESVDGKLYKEIENVQKYAQQTFKKYLTETEKTLDDYVKKYGDYTDKVAEIERDRLAKLKRLNETYYNEDMRKKPEYLRKQKAINNAAAREASNAAFENFKDSELYVMMFENLDNVSGATLKLLKQRLEGVRDSMQDLKPDQLKTIATQIEKINKLQIKRNPFKGLGKNLKEYLKNYKDWKQAEQSSLRKQNTLKNEEDRLAALKKRLELLKSQGKYGTMEYRDVEQQLLNQEEIVKKHKEELKQLIEKLRLQKLINDELAEQLVDLHEILNANIDSLSDITGLMKDAFGVEIPELDGFVSGLQRASNSVESIVKSILSGNVVGAMAGLGNFVYGIYDGFASLFGGGSAKNKNIDKEIEKSERDVKRLENAYKDLERQVTKSLGTEETLAKKAEIANKQAQLSQAKRQLELERSRAKKYRDADKILDLEGRVKELEHDIEDATNNIVNDLLGSGVKDAAESFVSTWLDAWKQGESTMDALKGSFDDMIETMITKSLASTLVAARLRKIYAMVADFTSEQSEQGVGLSVGELQRLRATMDEGGGIIEGINKDLTNLFTMLGFNAGYGEKSGTGNLSALQQGIQSITEDTAVALEAYMNSVSQQVYLHSDLLTQILNAVVGYSTNADVNSGTQAQMLLQLQASYQVQLSIQAMLNGWSNPSGSAMRVQMI